MTGLAGAYLDIRCAFVEISRLNPVASTLYFLPCLLAWFLVVIAQGCSVKFHIVCYLHWPLATAVTSGMNWRADSCVPSPSILFAKTQALAIV